MQGGDGSAGLPAEKPERRKDTGFDTYQIPKFSWVPKIDCIILERKDKPPKGGGEPAIVPMSAVIGNAIHAVEPIQGLRMDGIVLVDKSLKG